MRATNKNYLNGTRDERTRIVNAYVKAVRMDREVDESDVLWAATVYRTDYDHLLRRCRQEVADQLRADRRAVERWECDHAWEVA